MWPLTMGSGESQWPAGRQSRWIIVAPSQMNWNPLYQCWAAKKVSKPTNDMMVHYSNVMQREWRKLQINVQRQQSAASQTSSKYKWLAHFKSFICTLVSLSCLLSGILKNLSTYTSCISNDSMMAQGGSTWQWRSLELLLLQLFYTAASLRHFSHSQEEHKTSLSLTAKQAKRIVTEATM